MDSTTSSLSSSPAAGARRGCRVNYNRLTLVTLVVAVAGFAGTALAATPIDCHLQAALAASAWLG